MSFDKLKGKMTESRMSQEKLACHLGITENISMQRALILYPEHLIITASSGE